MVNSIYSPHRRDISMRAIEFCIPSLAYIFGFLLTTHIVQPVQDWALGVEVFGSVLFFPHAVRVLTAWLYGWKSIFLLMDFRYSSMSLFCSPIMRSNWLLSLSMACSSRIKFKALSSERRPFLYELMPFAYEPL